ncbi:MAG TPA: acyl-CoA dehydrogenase family protein [candidate division Zixibacteria bacterium]|nr:acyl-CoA dehydrogenase family protein [candidate division Zixibacteria bacterium]
MDFQLTEEERLIRDTAAQFVRRELISREGDYLRQRQPFLPPGDPPRRDLDREVRAGLEALARRAGLWLLELPEAEGGAGIGAVARALVYREFGRTILPFEPPALPGLLAGSRHAGDLASGKRSLALAFAELHRTGAPDEVSLRFREVAGGYRLGNATVELYGPPADLFLFPAREAGTRLPALFLVPRDAPGLEVEEEGDLTTDTVIARVTFRDCTVPGDCRLGYEYEVASVVAAEQLRIAARCLGIGARCLNDAIEHARNRVTFGRPLAARQAIQWMLADLSVQLRACTWLTLEAAWRADRGAPYFEAAALAKKRAARTAFEAADVAIQIHGGYGVCKELPFEGFYREARMLRLLYGREAELDRAAGERFLKGE